MPLSLFDASAIPALEQAAYFTEARHAILAGNVANLDTPGYRVRDLSTETFQTRLKEALGARSRMQKSLSPGMAELIPPVDFSAVRETTRSILYHDDSDVGLEHQVAEISKNQMMHNMAITIMTNQFRLLQAAISGNV